ncbi:MAG: sulfotransferase family 2 domain-containing protein, partial [Candidatus Thiodiazotropha sp.]
MPAAVLDKHKIAYFSIPKSASTSMKLVLYFLKHGKEWTGDPDRVHPQFPTYPISDEDFQAVQDYWKFTIVRDPISRLLSSYGNRVHFHSDIVRDAAPRLQDKLIFLLFRNELSLRPKYDDYFINLKKYQELSYSIWHHTTSVSTFIGSDLSRLSRIYRIEDIPNLENELTVRTGMQVALPREQTSGIKV